MKLRLFFALIVVVLAAAAYLWLSPLGGVPTVVSLRSTPSSVSDRPSASVPTSASPGPNLRPATPEPDQRPALAQTISAVMAGQPLVRSTPAPTPQPAAKPGASVADAPPSAALRQAVADEKQDLENVRMMLGNYRTRMGENPVGSNAEIMKKVMGDNPVGARLGPPEGQSINAEGELVDRWGTPYFFHQLAADKMEVRSAGPDKKMWTSDDVITK